MPANTTTLAALRVAIDAETNARSIYTSSVGDMRAAIATYAEKTALRIAAEAIIATAPYTPTLGEVAAFASAMDDEDDAYITLQTRKAQMATRAADLDVAIADRATAQAAVLAP